MFEQTGAHTFPFVSCVPAVHSKALVTTLQMTIVSFPTSETSIGVEGEI